MNPSFVTAVSPTGRRRVLEIGARTLAFAGAALLILGLTFGITQAAGANPKQPIQIDGIEIYFGFIPAEILRGHPLEHEEQTMHGGVPVGRGVRHLIVTVFDAKTRARITAASVTGSVVGVGMSTQTRKLEKMLFGGTVSYGNFFSMSNDGPYEIVVDVRRAGTGRTVTARFRYWVLS